MKGQGLVEYALILVLVAVVVIMMIAVIGQAFIHTTVPHVLVTDKQEVGWQDSDLVVTALVNDHKQAFLARNGAVYALISVGDTCDFETYPGSQGTTIISQATCTGSQK